MKIDIIKLYQDHNIFYQTEGHRHCRPGWVNIECPFCQGNHGYHLGITLEGTHSYCWRCGWKPIFLVLSKLLSTSEHKAKQIAQKYSTHSIIQEIVRIKPRIKSFKYPSCITPLLPAHEKYLKKRNFDPTYLEKTWDLLGTGILSILDGVNYGNRILIPIKWEGAVVSFQTRDVTDKHLRKYMVCPKEREIINLKQILYGNQKTWNKQTPAICVEGVTDVWRLYPYNQNTFAVMGIEYTPKQIRLIAKNFKKVFVAFDDDPQAQVKAKNLIAELSFRGIESYNITMKGDPGSLSNEEAEKLCSQIYT